MTPEALTRLAGRLVDLTLPIEPGMIPILPESDPTLETLQDHQTSDFGVRETRLRMSVHVGTHMDYPSHVDPDGAVAFPDDPMADSLFPGATLTLAFLMAFDGKQGSAPFRGGAFEWGEEITEGEIEAWFAAFDSAHPGLDRAAIRGAVLRTGWNDDWFTPGFFDRGSPTLSDGAARALVARGLDYIGSDFLLPIAPGRTHDIVMKGSHRYQVENLWNLGALSGPVIGLLLAPLKIRGAEGLPARVYGVDLGFAKAV